MNPLIPNRHPFDANNGAERPERGVVHLSATTDHGTSSRTPQRVASNGWMVVTPTAAHPYKVVLEYGTGADSQHAASSMLQGEAFIRSMLPPAPRRDTLHDRGSPVEYPQDSSSLGGDDAVRA